MGDTKFKGSNYLRWSRVVRVILKAHDIILFRFKTFGCITRLSDRGIKQCTRCGCTNHYIDGDNSSSLLVDQVLISKTEYDSLLQRANASSSLLIASGNTCLHSSSSPSWVIDSGASDHMTDNSSLLSHTSSPCSLHLSLLLMVLKLLSKGKDLKTKRMIGGGFVKDGLYYFQPSSTSIPSALHSTNSAISVALSS
uniref:Retrotransposon Copia-like N-terminal domain-containing protein n=1 Tax=Fagus sylvatica TaxID=28930 RepID=A0A2N9HX62_FAGSY